MKEVVRMDMLQTLHNLVEDASGSADIKTFVVAGRYELV
jgi:hypothetical protein